MPWLHWYWSVMFWCVLVSFSLAYVLLFWKLAAFSMSFLSFPINSICSAAAWRSFCQKTDKGVYSPWSEMPPLRTLVLKMCCVQSRALSESGSDRLWRLASQAKHAAFVALTFQAQNVQQINQFETLRAVEAPTQSFKGDVHGEV